MRKSFVCLVVVLAMVIGLCIPAAAAYEKTVNINHRAIKIVLNDELIVPCDGAGKTVEPFIMTETGTTYLPLRAIAQALGLYVDWDEATNTVKLTSGGRVKTGDGKSGETVGTSNVKVTYRDIRIFLDGKELELVNRDGVKVEPFILNSNSSVYLPLRIIGEALGLPVQWRGDISTAYINCSSNTVANHKVEKVSLSATDVRGRVGDYFRLEAYVEPASAVNKTITWTSSNNDIVRVNAEGTVVLQGKGVAEIVATSENGKTARCKVVVRDEAGKDPYIEELGYSYSEIVYLRNSANAAEKSLEDAMVSIGKAENASSMGAIYAAAAISHVEKAAKQLSTALIITKNGLPIKLSEGKYATVNDLVEAALAPLNEVVDLKVGNENLALVIGMLTDAVAISHPLVEELQKASADTLALFDGMLSDEEDKDEGESEEEDKGEEEDKQEEKDTVILDEAGVKITAKKFTAEDKGDHELKLYIENNSGKDLEIYCENATINDFMVDASLAAVVLNGKKANDKIIFEKESIEENGIETINTIEFVLRMVVKGTQDVYLKSQTISIAVEKENGTDNEGGDDATGDILDGILGDLDNEQLGDILGSLDKDELEDFLAGADKDELEDILNGADPDELEDLLGSSDKDELQDILDLLLGINGKKSA